MIASSLVFGAAAIAAITDIRSRKIPNWLVAILLACGLALRATEGISAIGTSLAVLLAVLLVGTFAFSMRITGGGDVKFMAAGAAALGWPHALPFILYSLIAGGVLAVAVTIARGRTSATFSNLRVMSYSLLAGAQPAAPARSVKVPYALAFLAGSGIILLGNLLALNSRIPL
jgi:prepilin peptidase CpaA